MAEELQLKGLTGSGAENEDNEKNHKPPEHQTKKNMLQKVTSRDHLETNVATKEIKFDIFESKELVPSCIREIATVTDDRELKTTIQSMMQRVDGIWRCTQCGKNDKWKQHIQNHSEGKHIKGVSYPCS